MKGEIMGYIDVAQVTLYVFWIFFAYLIIYIRSEDKREGYPLEADVTGREEGIFYPPMPAPKTFHLAGGKTVTVPSGKGDTRLVKAERTAGFPGAPLHPTGNPLLSGAGPASYAERADVPDITLHGEPRIVPLRAAPGFGVAAEDKSPIGYNVIGADGAVAGTLRDIWVDRSETIIRYYEVEVKGSGRRVLLPFGFATIDGRRGRVNVASILASQFADVPGTAKPDQVTLLEEDKIVGYFGGGHLYATPGRIGPML